MASLFYLSNELRRRRGRTIVTAAGLALGVGLVMGIIGVSQGLRDAQTSVLKPLGSVGTDILVTRTVGATAATASASPSPSPSAAATTGRGGFFGGGPGLGGGPGGAGQALQSLNAADTQALLSENSSVVTDLSKLGKAGTHFEHDFFVPGTLISFPDAAVASLSKLANVTSVVGALTLTAQHQSGTVPQITATIKTGGNTLTATARPAPMTAAEEQAFRTCVEKAGGFTFGQGGGGNAPAPNASGAPPAGGGDGGRGGFRRGAFNSCLPQRFQVYQATVIEPLRTLSTIVNPPQTDTATNSYTVAGIDPSHPETGLVTKNQLQSGAWINTTDATQVLANTAYASMQSLKVGSVLTINSVKYTVVGLVTPTLTGNTADLYFNLSELQKVATKTGRVNEVLLKVNNAANVSTVAAQIKAALPGAEVLTAASLASGVTGSLSDARKLADRLGGALAVIVLLAAFVIAALLTMSSVAKRVREIGTLRAIGWSRGRVVRQIVSETVGIGLLGGLLGLVLGIAVCAAVGALAPTLDATTNGFDVGNSAVSRIFGQASQAVTTQVKLHAPISISTVLLGMVVAIFGGLIAGTAGGWRAARLAPATALRDLG